MSVNVFDRLNEISEFFSPKVIDTVNESFVKVAKIKGDRIPWHTHEFDEAFYILKGKLLLECEKEVFTMKKGDFFVVPKGSNHKVSSSNECHIILLEHKETAHTGKVDSDITKSIEDQLS